MRKPTPQADPDAIAIATTYPRIQPADPKLPRRKPLYSTPGWGRCSRHDVRCLAIMAGAFSPRAR